MVEATRTAMFNNSAAAAEAAGVNVTNQTYTWARVSELAPDMHDHHQLLEVRQHIVSRRRTVNALR